jgi:hypothetical protein
VRSATERHKRGRPGRWSFDVCWWPLPKQVEAEGRDPVTRFDQLPLPAHAAVDPRPARDGKGLRGRRTVQELRHDVPARLGVCQRAVLLGLGRVENHTRAPVVPDLGAAVGGEHQVTQDHLVSLTEPRSTQVVRPQVEGLPLHDIREARNTGYTYQHVGDW